MPGGPVDAELMPTPLAPECPVPFPGEPPEAADFEEVGETVTVPSEVADSMASSVNCPTRALNPDSEWAPKALVLGLIGDKPVGGLADGESTCPTTRLQGTQSRDKVVILVVI